MKFSVLGDSISTFKGWIPLNYHWYYPRKGNNVTSVDDTWWYKLKINLNWEIDVINSFSGSRITNTNQNRPINSYFANPNRYNNIGNPDVLLIFGGVNDFGSDMNPPSLKLFKESYSYLISQIKENYLKTTIIPFTPLQVGDSFAEKNFMGVSLLDIRNTIIEICEQNDLNYIDLFQLNSEEILSQDIHPSKNGMKIISNYISNSLKSIF